MAAGKQKQSEGSKNRWRALASGGRSDEFLWRDMPAEAVTAVITAVVGTGGAVTFGRTKDGGAGILSIYDGSERTVMYCADAEEFAMRAALILEIASQA